MKTHIRDLKANLSKMGDLAHSGKTVVVTKNGKPWFDLVPHKKRQRSVDPFPEAARKISEADAISPASPEDLQGWT